MQGDNATKTEVATGSERKCSFTRNQKHNPKQRIRDKLQHLLKSLGRCVNPMIGKYIYSTCGQKERKYKIKFQSVLEV